MSVTAGALRPRPPCLCALIASFTDPHRVSKEFRGQLAAAALPRIPLHGLRHTYATLALSSGVNPRIVSGRLGHSTVALTLDIYSHVLPQADQEAADRSTALIA